MRNSCHPQSDETRLKISIGVREGCRRRCEMLSVQERCVLEWQSFLAEASHKGYGGQEELQWDSYKVLNERIKVDWLANAKLRRTVSHSKGTKRAPKSLEVRRKISEAIFAKWADPGYRERVRAAHSKYYGKALCEKGRKRLKIKAATQRRISGLKETPTFSGVNGSSKCAKSSFVSNKKVSDSLFTDPISSSELEMIKSVRLKRTADVETQKREAAERAKLLIAEAEKAAKALEIAALTSPLAQASLLESWKLIAEAMRSLRSIESGISVSSHGDKPDGQVDHDRDEVELKSDPGHV